MRVLVRASVLPYAACGRRRMLLLWALSPAISCQKPPRPPRRPSPPSPELSAIEGPVLPVLLSRCPAVVLPFPACAYSYPCGGRPATATNQAHPPPPIPSPTHLSGLTCTLFFHHHPFTGSILTLSPYSLHQETSFHGFLSLAFTRIMSTLAP